MFSQATVDYWTWIIGCHDWGFPQIVLQLNFWQLLVFWTAFYILSNFSSYLLILRYWSSFLKFLNWPFFPDFITIYISRCPNHGRKIKAAWFLGQGFFENSKWWRWFTRRLTWVSREKTEVIPFCWLIIIIIFFGFNWEQSYLATLFTPKIAQKCLEILLLLYDLHILASGPKKFFLFEKLRETFWKIASNFWKALVMTENTHTWHWKTNVLVQAIK